MADITVTCTNDKNVSIAFRWDWDNNPFHLLGLTEYMVMIAMLPHQKTPQQTAAHTREARQRKETL